MGYQHTLARSASITGKGLHSGQPATLTLHPAPVDTGVVFMRKAQGQIHTCEASIHNLRPMELCTAIGTNGMVFQTTEHVLSALWALEIDNVYAELNGDEVPVMDGSAQPFVQLIQSVGIVPQKRHRAYLKILSPLEVGTNDRKVMVLPSPTPKITYSINYDHRLIQQQTYIHDWSVSNFKSNISRARTFAFSHEVEALWARGLGQGGSLDNTIVFSDTGILNERGLQFPDECVRHKILDLIGDIALMSVPIIGHIIAERSGHTLHNELVRTILDNPQAWTLLNVGPDHEPTLAKLSPTDSCLPEISPLPA